MLAPEPLMSSSSFYFCPNRRAASGSGAAPRNGAAGTVCRELEAERCGCAWRLVASLARLATAGLSTGDWAGSFSRLGGRCLWTLLSPAPRVPTFTSAVCTGLWMLWSRGVSLAAADAASGDLEPRGPPLGDRRAEPGCAELGCVSFRKQNRSPAVCAH